jgi:hypothetical protein
MWNRSSILITGDLCGKLINTMNAEIPVHVWNSVSPSQKIESYHEVVKAGFEVLIAATMKRSVIWDMMLCKPKLRGFSPQGNYTDRATAACRRSSCQLFRIEGVAWSAQRIPTAVNLEFLDPELLLFHSSSSSVILMRLSGPRSRSENLVASGIETGVSGSIASPRSCVVFTNSLMFCSRKVLPQTSGWKSKPSKQ